MPSQKYRRETTVPRCARRLTIAVLATACALLGACTVSSDQASSDRMAPDSSGSAASTTPSPPSGGSPLSAYFPNWNGAGQEVFSQEQAASSQALELRFQQSVAECMAQQGFTYVPWVNPLGMVALLADAPAQGTMEYAQRYGLGVIDSPLTPPADAPVDPNETYKMSLSPAERYAFNSALEGKNMADIARGFEEGNPVSKYGTPPPADGGGCRGEASRALVPEDQDDDARAVQELYSAAKTAVSSLDTDPRVIEALRDWSDCMIDAGYPRFDRRIDVFNHFMSQTPALDRSDSSAVAAFKSREVTAAVDDLTCADSSGYAAVYDGARSEIERKFIANHQAELDAYLAKYGDQ